jgi:hypothetical protein
VNRIEPHDSGLYSCQRATRRLGVIQSPVLEEELALSRPAPNRVVPVGFWRRVDNSTVRVYGVKVKIHEQQRGKEFDIESRKSRADTSRPP